MCSSVIISFTPAFTLTCALLCFRRSLDHDWLLCWTLTYSNCVAPSAVTWKLKTQRNTGLNQRSCWTNWLTFICSWIVLALLKQLLMIRWAPEGWRRSQRLCGQTGLGRTFQKHFILLVCCQPVCLHACSLFPFSRSSLFVFCLLFVGCSQSFANL